MTTPITRLCPHCQRDYDISHRMHSNRVYCLCGGWSAVVMFPDGRTELRPCDAPDGSAAAGETTEAAALVLEMNAMRAELGVAKAARDQAKAFAAEEIAHAIRDMFSTRRRADALRAELEAVQAEAAALRETLEWRHNCEGCSGKGCYWVDVEGEAEVEVCDCWIRADHVLYHEEYNAGKALLDELVAARAVVVIARRGFGTAEDVTKAEAFDPVALTRAIEAYDQAIKK